MKRRPPRSGRSEKRNRRQTMTRRSTRPVATLLKSAPTLLMTTGELLVELQASRTWLWHERRAGRFPAPVQLGKFSIRWRRSDIERWIVERQGTAA